MICIKNGRIHDAVHETPYIGNILIEEDKIISIGSDFSVPVDAHIIDAGGMEVYPGFVEAHCHLGLEEYGIGYEGMDINELNDAVTPQMRGIDSINPLDPTFEKAAMAVLPVSAPVPEAAMFSAVHLQLSKQSDIVSMT